MSDYQKDDFWDLSKEINKKSNSNPNIELPRRSAEFEDHTPLQYPAISVSYVICITPRICNVFLPLG